MQLKIGVVNLITFSMITLVFICWMIPIGRSQLKIVSEDVYAEMNFNELSIDNAKKISKILLLPEIPLETDIIGNNRRRIALKTPNKPGLFNFNLLWKYFYLILGFYLFIIGWVVQILDLQINWSLGMFLVPLLTIFGLKNIIYGWSEHYYQQHYYILEKDSENCLSSFSKKLFMCYRMKTISGFKIGLKELKQVRYNHKNRKLEKIKNMEQIQSNTPQLNMIFPFDQLNRSNFRPITWFNLFLIFLIFYYVLYQSLRYYGPFKFYINNNYFSPISYKISALLIIIPIILIFLKSSLPSLKGNDEKILEIIYNSKYNVKNELFIRILIIILFIFIPSILILNGITLFI